MSSVPTPRASLVSAAEETDLQQDEAHAETIGTPHGCWCRVTPLRSRQSSQDSFGGISDVSTQSEYSNTAHRLSRWSARLHRAVVVGRAPEDICEHTDGGAVSSHQSLPGMPTYHPPQGCRSMQCLRACCSINQGHEEQERSCRRFRTCSFVPFMSFGRSQAAATSNAVHHVSAVTHILGALVLSGTLPQSRHALCRAVRMALQRVVAPVAGCNSTVTVSPLGKNARDWCTLSADALGHLKLAFGIALLDPNDEAAAI
mmetsp:Transcript_131837/g.263108  ORF Transcript_131837/g.263108 Transcript_131837/m.263108 type:complete len:258 (-) Transcript_131837:544-1317(-)